MVLTTSKLKYAIAIIFSLSTIILSLSVSLQAPFYPLVAEKKGASPLQYGIVFGVFNFILLVFCLIYGKIIPHVGAKLVSYTGIFSAGVCNILFGFVDKVNDTTVFIALSIAIRIIEAIGYAGFRTASISIISSEFSDTVEIGFGFIQASFGFGVVIGPAIGGVLFEIGGFTLPFGVVGCVLTFVAIILLFLPFKCVIDFKDGESKYNFRHLLKFSTTLLSMLSVFVVYLTFGFFEAALEPHIRQLNLPPKYIGLMFTCFALSFSISSFLWGKLISKCDSPKLIWSVGAFICILSLLLIGPAPYFNFNLSTEVSIVALLLYGVGEGAQTVGGFAGINKTAKLAGFPQSMQTHSIISTLYMCSVTSGLFIGPIFGGFLYDNIGFRWSTQLYSCLLLVLIVLTLISKITCDRN
ncbi:UNVERIFIED_CONTAM: hypothetical protein RMT77_006835 [Armadillidium vulgare]